MENKDDLLKYSMDPATDAFNRVLKRVIETNKKVEEFAKELEAAKRLLWLSIHVNGGVVKIPDEAFIKTQNNQELECSYDNVARETIIKAKISIPEFTPSSTAPDKP